MGMFSVDRNISFGPLMERQHEIISDPANRALRGRENLRKGWILGARKESQKIISNWEGKYLRGKSAENLQRGRQVPKGEKVS